MPAWSSAITRSLAARVRAAYLDHLNTQLGYFEELAPLPGLLAEAKKKGVLRLEGKDYVVRDGDVVHFRFNV